MTETTLGDIAEIRVGFPFRSSAFLKDGSGTRLLRGDNITPGSLRWDNAMTWPTSSTVDSDYALRAGDVVLAMDRPWIGAGLKVAIVRPHDVPSFLVQRVARLRARPGVSQGYVAALAASGDFTQYLLSVQTGTAVPHVSARQIAAFPVQRFPQIAEQMAIAEVLGALDDKIAANTHLANLAERLFSARFTALLTGGEAAPLSKFADFVNGRAFTKNASGSGRVVIRIAELNSGLGGSTVYNDIDVDEKHLAHPGDILFAWSGSLTTHRWFRDTGIVNQHIFKVIPRDNHPAWLVWALLDRKIDEFRAIAADKATTMGHIQRRHLDEPVLTPAPGAIASAHTSMSALWDSAHNARLENESLAATRDALLPALMSGCLRIEKPERGAIDRSRRTLSQGALKDRLPGKE